MLGKDIRFFRRALILILYAGATKKMWEYHPPSNSKQDNCESTFYIHVSFPFKILLLSSKLIAQSNNLMLGCRNRLTSYITGSVDWCLYTQWCTSGQSA